VRKLVLAYLPILLLCLWLKGCRAALLLPQATPRDFADALAPELGVHALLLGTAGLATYAATRRATRAAAAVSLGLAALLLALLELLAVSFAQSTGAALDHHLFGFALAQGASLLPILYSEVPLSKFVSLGLIAAAAVGLPIWWMARRQADAPEVRAAAALLACGVLLLALTPLRVPPGVAAPMPVALALGPWLQPLRAAPESALQLPLHAPAAALAPIVAGGPPRYDHLVIVALESTGFFASSLGEPSRDTTPFLRALTDSSVAFERAYAAVPHSSKALVAIGCGIYPFLLMQVRESEPGGIPVRCLPALLKAVGFQTLYFGSHVGGFESWRQLTRNLGFGVSITAEQIDTEGFEIANYFAYEDDAMLDPSRRWLERARGKRIFAFYLTSAAHHDYRMLSRYPLQAFAEDERENRYLNAVHYQDRFLEKLVDQYRDLGLYERTLFVIVGDHGEAFGEHGRNMHDAVIHDEVIRIPLLIHAADMEPRRIPHVVSQVDILPSALELLGFRVDGGSYDGSSVFARGDASVVHASCWYSERCLARIGPRRKIISHFGHAPPEAYAIAEDPRELHDVFGRRESDEHELAALHAWKEQQLGRFLLFYEGRRR
jgi:arylsulfatase A-like enzyme